MLEFQQVGKAYGKTAILHDVNVVFHKASFHFICGKSGSGKSTLLKLIDCEITPDEGVILWCGRPLSSYKKFMLRRDMGIIFQSFELIQQMTVLENVLLAGRVVGKSAQQLLPRAEKLLKRVGLADKKHAYPYELSGGQMQHVAIVRALLNQPKLLLADEPTGNLDTETTNEVMQLLYELHKEEHMTMIIVTHSQELLTSFNATKWLVKDGSVYEQ